MNTNKNNNVTSKIKEVVPTNGKKVTIKEVKPDEKKPPEHIKIIGK